MPELNSNTTASQSDHQRDVIWTWMLGLGVVLRGMLGIVPPTPNSDMKGSSEERGRKAPPTREAQPHPIRGSADVTAPGSRVRQLEHGCTYV